MSVIRSAKVWRKADASARPGGGTGCKSDFRLNFVQTPGPGRFEESTRVAEDKEAVRITQMLLLL